MFTPLTDLEKYLINSMLEHNMPFFDIGSLSYTLNLNPEIVKNFMSEKLAHIQTKELQDYDNGYVTTIETFKKRYEHSI